MGETSVKLWWKSYRWDSHFGPARRQEFAFHW